VKRVFQLVHSTDGIRSAPVVTTREDLAKVLWNEGQYLEGVTADDLVLVLGEVDDNEDFSFLQVPLMRVDNFCAHFGGVHNG